MEVVYPDGPRDVPEDLTRPGSQYRSRVWLASLLLAFFLLTYFALIGYFGFKTYGLTQDLINDGFLSSLEALGVAIACAFFTLFLVKGLFFIKHSDIETDIEVTEADQPQLFEFLHRLADEAGAPRPHRVFLSGRVNAAVYYDLTPLNLIVPTKKNLEVGLALVNSLTLTELKAVLAHEFGHFAQRSMAVGRWIYTAQQVANYLIYKRDMMDKFLSGLSRFDLRVAWIGWLMSLIIWSLRAVLDTLFSLVVLAQRSLSRQMEFNADLVSVSLTGSDALVNALHKLTAADDSWDRALQFALRERNRDRVVGDLFVMQKFISRNVKQVLADEFYDEAPPIPAEDPAGHRVFKSESLLPPQMWSTHPVNSVRESNAKSTYVPAPQDDRSAWVIFNDPKGLRERMTQHLLEAGPGVESLTALPMAEATRDIKESFAKARYHQRFRGVYLGRTLTRHCLDFEDLYDAASREDLKQTIRDLYSEEFSDALDRWNQVHEELLKLQAVKDGRLKPHDGVIRHRGKDIAKSDLSSLIKTMEREVSRARDKVCDFDRACRTVSIAAAKKLPGDWADYLRNLLNLLHCAEHTQANLRDAQGYLSNIWAVVTADNKISSRERKRLLEASQEVYLALESAWNDHEAIALNAHLQRRLNTSTWSSLLPEQFELHEPTEDSLANWLEVVDSWLDLFCDRYSQLTDALLEELLAAEHRIQRAFLQRKDPGKHPGLNGIPADYVRLLDGQERQRQTRLDWWDRFITADGLLPGAIRFALAATIVGAVIWYGQTTSMATVNIYNGLATTVMVTLGEQQLELAPDSATEVSVVSKTPLQISAGSRDGTAIENFEVTPESSIAEYVYNIAGASPLVQWHQIYGEATAPDDINLGNDRWLTSQADYVFEETPDEISTSGSSDGGYRSVLSGIGYMNPERMSEYIDDASLNEMAVLRATYDEPDSEYIYHWMNLVRRNNQLEAVLSQRLLRNPDELLANIYQQENAASDEAYAAVCQRQTERANSLPDNADLSYLAVRCMNEFEQQRDAHFQAYSRWPDHPFHAYRAGLHFAYQARWQQANDALVKAYNNNAGLRESVVMHLARVQRALGIDNPESMDALSDYSSYLNMIHAIEVGDDLPNGYDAYTHLHQADFGRALQIAGSFEMRTSAINLLVAASDGAESVHLLNAQSLLNAEGVDAVTVFSAVALALKHNLPTEPLTDSFSHASGEDSSAMFQFTNLLASDSFSTSAAERILNTVDPDVRGFAYMMGVIYLGENAPQEWRDLARRLLFTYERPYFSS